VVSIQRGVTSLDTTSHRIATIEDYARFLGYQVKVNFEFRVQIKG